MVFEFTFEVSSRIHLGKVYVTVDGEPAGVLHLSRSEWEVLRPILLHGNGLYMDGEGSIVINDRSKQAAYLEGV